MSTLAMYMTDKHIVNHRNREFVDSVFLDHSVVESSFSAPPPHAAGNSAIPPPPTHMGSRFEITESKNISVKLDQFLDLLLL